MRFHGGVDVVGFFFPFIRETGWSSWPRLIRVVNKARRELQFLKDKKRCLQRETSMPTSHRFVIVEINSQSLHLPGPFSFSKCRKSVSRPGRLIFTPWIYKLILFVFPSIFFHFIFFTRNILYFNVSLYFEK